MQDKDITIIAKELQKNIKNKKDSLETLNYLKKGSKSDDDKFEISDLEKKIKDFDLAIKNLIEAKKFLEETSKIGTMGDFYEIAGEKIQNIKTPELRTMLENIRSSSPFLQLSNYRDPSTDLGEKLFKYQNNALSRVFASQQEERIAGNGLDSLDAWQEKFWVWAQGTFKKLEEHGLNSAVFDNDLGTFNKLVDIIKDRKDFPVANLRSTEEEFFRCISQWDEKYNKIEQLFSRAKENLQEKSSKDLVDMFNELNGLKPYLIKDKHAHFDTLLNNIAKEQYRRELETIKEQCQRELETIKGLEAELVKIADVTGQLKSSSLRELELVLERVKELKKQLELKQSKSEELKKQLDLVKELEKQEKHINKLKDSLTKTIDQAQKTLMGEATLEDLKILGNALKGLEKLIDRDVLYLKARNKWQEKELEGIQGEVHIGSIWSHAKKTIKEEHIRDFEKGIKNNIDARELSVQQKTIEHKITVYKILELQGHLDRWQLEERNRLSLSNKFRDETVQKLEVISKKIKSSFNTESQSVPKSEIKESKSESNSQKNIRLDDTIDVLNKSIHELNETLEKLKAQETEIAKISNDITTIYLLEEKGLILRDAALFLKSDLSNWALEVVELESLGVVNEAISKIEKLEKSVLDLIESVKLENDVLKLSEKAKEMRAIQKDLDEAKSKLKFQLEKSSTQFKAFQKISSSFGHDLGSRKEEFLGLFNDLGQYFGSKGGADSEVRVCLDKMDSLIKELEVIKKINEKRTELVNSIEKEISVRSGLGTPDSIYRYGLAELQEIQKDIPEAVKPDSKKIDYLNAQSSLKRIEDVYTEANKKTKEKLKEEYQSFQDRFVQIEQRYEFIQPLLGEGVFVEASALKNKVKEGLNQIEKSLSEEKVNVVEILESFKAFEEAEKSYKDQEADKISFNPKDVLKKFNDYLKIEHKYIDIKPGNNQADAIAACIDELTQLAEIKPENVQFSDLTKLAIVETYIRDIQIDIQSKKLKEHKDTFSNQKEFRKAFIALKAKLERLEGELVRMSASEKYTQTKDKIRVIKACLEAIEESKDINSVYRVFEDLHLHDEDTNNSKIIDANRGWGISKETETRRLVNQFFKIAGKEKDKVDMPALELIKQKEKEFYDERKTIEKNKIKPVIDKIPDLQGRLKDLSKPLEDSDEMRVRHAKISGNITSFSSSSTNPFDEEIKENISTNPFSEIVPKNLKEAIEKISEYQKLITEIDRFNAYQEKSVRVSDHKNTLFNKTRPNDLKEKLGGEENYKVMYDIVDQMIFGEKDSLLYRVDDQRKRFFDFQKGSLSKREFFSSGKSPSCYDQLMEQHKNFLVFQNSFFKMDPVEKSRLIKGALMERFEQFVQQGKGNQNEFEKWMTDKSFYHTYFFSEIRIIGIEENVERTLEKAMDNFKVKGTRSLKDEFLKDNQLIKEMNKQENTHKFKR